MTNLKAEEIIGRRVTEALPGIENDEFGWIDVYGRVALTGEPVSFEQYFAPFEKWYSISAYCPVDGYFACVVTDITERRRTAEALRERERRLAVTLRSIGDGVIVTDTQGLVVALNPVAESLTGWTQAEASGRRLSEVFHIINMDTRAEVENPVDKVLREGRVVGLANHTLLVSRDGRELPIDDSGAPIIDEEAGLIGVVLVFRDVIEKTRADEALRNIEWLLSEPGKSEEQDPPYRPSYGDLTELNESGLILSAVGPDLLRDITEDYLKLLGTSTAVYEADGRYALGIFASG